ncbi:MAG: PAS domain S-box protein, partial [Gammaproteobacteria bacterium]|nr:PAS domain S-box protein [Gammaproteobacteria bacterium]
MSVAIARNITVRKQAEEMLQKAHDELERMVEERTAELAKSEARYRQMVENPLVGVWQADIKGRFVFISKRLAEMSGYSQDEVIGMSMMVPIAPELRSLLAERMQKRKAGKLPPEVVEAEMVRKDGSRYTALVAPATLYDEEEKFNGFIGTMIDITERKRAEEKIKKLSSAVEQSIDGIAIGDLGPKLTYVNNAFSRMHGYSAEEMIGMKVANLHNEEQMDEYERDMHQIKTQGSWIGELGHIRKDGTPFPTYMSVTLLKDDNGMPAGIPGVARDITEQKRTEQALREREKELKIKTKNLEETNTALRVLLKKRDEDRTE